MVWEIKYYNKQVQRSVDGFPADILNEVHQTLALLEKFGPVAIPGKNKHWEGDVWEITANKKSGWGRVMHVSIDNNTIWILYSFMKKTNTTPNNISKIVRKRAKEVKNVKK